MARTVENGIADGTFRPDLDPFQTAMVLWAQTRGLLLISKMHPKEVPFDDLKMQAFSFIERAIAAERP